MLYTLIKNTFYLVKLYSLSDDVYILALYADITLSVLPAAVAEASIRNSTFLTAQLDTMSLGKWMCNEGG